MQLFLRLYLNIFLAGFQKKFKRLMRLIGLQKAHFCTVLGHPISKPVSSDLSDSDIIGRFRRICRNLFHYYSGSSKKKDFISNKVYTFDFLVLEL